jgi:SAM-dependent methyltransferase
MSVAPTPASGELSAAEQLLFEELLSLERAMERNYRWVYEQIAPWLGRSILEVGSGAGVMSKFFVGRGDPVVLSDYHPAYVAALAARFASLPAVECRVLDLLTPPYDIGSNRVDTIVCLNVLEHLPDDARVLRGFSGLLAGGGRIVLQVPNHPWLFGSLDESYGHERRYTWRGLAALLEGEGFHVRWLRCFNPLAIPGWIVSGKLLRSRRVSPSAARFFNALVPLAKRVDVLSRVTGLALLACGEKE